MNSKTEAEALVRNELRKIETAELPFDIDESKTIEKEFGWVFFYNSARYLRSKEIIYQLAGNGPIFFNKMTGAITVSGASKPIDVLIEEYERQTM